MLSLQGRKALCSTNGARPVGSRLLTTCEKKVTCLTDAAVFANEFLLTHKSVFSPSACHEPVSVGQRDRSPKSFHCNPTAATGDPGKRECFCCHEQGHLIAMCPTLKRKVQAKNGKTPSPIGFTQTWKVLIWMRLIRILNHSLLDKPVLITILWDTGAKQSLMCDSILPLSAQSYCGYDIVA